MRGHVRDLVKALNTIEGLFKTPLYEFGSFIVNGQEQVANLRDIFPSVEYIGCDARPGNGVDKIEDMMRLTLPDNSIGTYLSIDTLEHVENCFLAFDEMHRVIREDGIALMITVMDFVIHEIPADYWRFTPMSFDLLSPKFDNKIIFKMGDVNKPHTVAGLFSKNPIIYAPIIQILLGHGAVIHRVINNKENKII